MSTLMRKGALTLAIKAARKAGDVIIRYMNRLDSLSVMQKERHDFVSEVDRLAEKEIIRDLKRAYPDHAFLGEESGRLGEAAMTWIIDPLDGTSNYLRGFPHFSISIALVEHDEPLVGVVYDPIRDELFTAIKGGGALVNERRIRVANRETLEGALLVTGFRLHEAKELAVHSALVREFLATGEDIRRTGSAALDLAYVAAGRVDGFWETGLKSWDVAAGSLLVKEAGGICTDFGGSQKLTEDMDVMAANPKLHARLGEMIRAHYPAS